MNYGRYDSVTLLRTLATVYQEEWVTRSWPRDIAK